MDILNVVYDNLPVFIVLLVILMINFCCILYLVFKERKEDKEEIEEILQDMNPKLEEEQDKKIEQNKKEVEEMLLKMQQDLETKPEDVVTNFENEQEEKSIISYQELLASVKEKGDSKVKPIKIEENKQKEEIKPEIEKTNITLEIEKPSIENEDDEEELFNFKEVTADDIKDENENTKKFKSTDFFISPIFGKQENNIKYPTVPKNNTTKIEEFINETNKDNLEMTRRLDEELTKNESFLKALKEFRRNLD